MEDMFVTSRKSLRLYKRASFGVLDERSKKEGLYLPCPPHISHISSPTADEIHRLDVLDEFKVKSLRLCKDEKRIMCTHRMCTISMNGVFLLFVVVSFW